MAYFKDIHYLLMYLLYLFSLIFLIYFAISIISISKNKAFKKCTTCDCENQSKRTTYTVFMSPIAFRVHVTKCYLQDGLIIYFRI